MTPTEQEFLARVLRSVHHELLGQHGLLITEAPMGATLTPDNAWRTVYLDHLRALELAMSMLGEAEPGRPTDMAQELEAEAPELREKIGEWLRASYQCQELRQAAAQKTLGRL